MKRAVIDLGTNTFNLLVGSVFGDKLEIIYCEKEAVLLGMNGINNGSIAEDAWMRAMQTLFRFKKRCEKQNVDEIIGFGTSALRGAKNGELFVKEVYENIGIRIHIISGSQEAQLIYRGVRWLFDFKQAATIMDIGGGSTEFIAANAGGIVEAQSFDIGVSRLYQNLNKRNNLTANDFKFINEYLEARTGRFFEEDRSTLLIGASGSFETFYEMIFQKKFTAEEKMVTLPLLPLLDQLNWVIDSRYEDRINHKWIVPMRKKMIPIAAFKIKWIIQKLNADRVLLSPYSLKEGAFGLVGDAII
jgi:exopolyphosphatase / guanosine-5'-triphosphate,3'-diphosphate pyrophosphatase